LNCNRIHHALLAQFCSRTTPTIIVLAVFSFCTHYRGVFLINYGTQRPQDVYRLLEHDFLRNLFLVSGVFRSHKFCSSTSRRKSSRSCSRDEECQSSFLCFGGRDEKSVAHMGIHALIEGLNFAAGRGRRFRFRYGRGERPVAIVSREEVSL
jgi:hypothetical protein